MVTVFKNEAGGLTESDIASIFDRFFTADRMRTGQNTGLGLAIVKIWWRPWATGSPPVWTAHFSASVFTGIRRKKSTAQFCAVLFLMV